MNEKSVFFLTELTILVGEWKTSEEERMVNSWGPVERDDGMFTDWNSSRYKPVHATPEHQHGDDLGAVY